MIKSKSKIIHRCENCGLERGRGESAGWTGGIGLGENRRSKYGRRYDRRGGWAWWCTSPICQRVKDRLCLRIFLRADVSDDILDAMIEQAEMEKIREN